MMKRPLSIVLCIGAIGAASRAADFKHCILPYVTVLSEGGFSGMASCDAGSFDAAEVGEITIAGRSFQIVDYRYRTRPVPGGSPRGGQRILIVENGKRYVGQYALGTPPFHRIWVQGSSVHIDLPEAQGNEIKFDMNGPLQKTYLAQEPATLFK